LFSENYAGEIRQSSWVTDAQSERITSLRSQFHNLNLSGIRRNLFAYPAAPSFYFEITSTFEHSRMKCCDTFDSDPGKSCNEKLTLLAQSWYRPAWPPDQTDGHGGQGSPNLS
jgi:hypothetical protein